MKTIWTMMAFAGSCGFSVKEMLAVIGLAGICAFIVFPGFANVGSPAGGPAEDSVLAKLQNAYNNWAYLGGTINGVSSWENASAPRGPQGAAGVVPEEGPVQAATGSSEAAAVFLKLVSSPSAERGSFSDGMVTAIDSSGSFGSTAVDLSALKVVYDKSAYLALLSSRGAARPASPFSPGTFYLTQDPNGCYALFYVPPTGIVEQVRLASNGVLDFAP